MKTATVTINGTAHEIKELPAARNGEWRRKFEAELGAVIRFVRALPNVEINTTQDLVAVVMDALPMLFDALDKAGELAVAYDPAFADAYDSEVADAYPALLGLAFPFGNLARQAPGMLGATPTPTT